MLAPYLPDLMTNFFAEHASGTPIHCEDFSSYNSKPPQACITGSAASVMWSSYSQFFSNAIIGFMFYPLTGVWSDMFGRKPFLMLSQALGMLPKLVVLFHVMFGMSLYPYYPVYMLNDMVSLLSASLATVSDCLPPEHRAAGFAVTLGSLSAGLAIAPLFGQILGLRGAAAVAVGLRGLGLLYTMVRPLASLIDCRPLSHGNFSLAPATERRPIGGIVEGFETLYDSWPFTRASL